MIVSRDDEILFSGNLSKDLNGAVSCLYKACGESQLKSVTLDFSNATYVDASIMLPICAYCAYYRLDRVTFSVIPPLKPELLRLFSNTNWMNIIQPGYSTDIVKRRSNNLPALQFLDHDSQFHVVNQAMDVLLETAKFDDRRKLKALEWAINEITDNVLNHAESQIGGILQLQCFPSKQKLSFYVADSGLGIPLTLRRSVQLTSDADALDRAIREGVTRNSKTNQGNGLYGTFKCCEVSDGTFFIRSNRATLNYKDNEFHVKAESVPYRGSFIVATIDYSSSNLLEKALVFKGKTFEPQNDYIDSHYIHNGDDIVFNVQSEVEGFGSREYGRRARTKLDNLMSSNKGKIIIDFSNIPIISSSFADEVFGKLFVELGPMEFMTRISFEKLDSTVQKLINRAISQRMKTE